MEVILEKNISVMQNVYNTIKEMILDGRYMPGVHLVEADLVHHFNVSRVTIREVLRLLAGDELVELIPNRGVIIRKLTLREIKEIYQVLEYLYGLAARLLAESGDPIAIQKLKETMAQDEKAVANQDFHLHLRLMIDFQNVITSACSNQTLIKSITHLQLLCELPEVVWMLRERNRMEFSMRSHNQIVDAICSGNPELAETVMREHIRGTIDKILSTNENMT